MTSSWSTPVGPKSNGKCRYKEHTEEKTGEGHGRWTRVGVMWPHGRPPASGQDPVQSLRREHPHFDFRLVASRAVREQIPVALKAPVCSHLFQWPQDLWTRAGWAGLSEGSLQLPLVPGGSRGKVWVEGPALCLPTADDNGGFPKGEGLAPSLPPLALIQRGSEAEQRTPPPRRRKGQTIGPSEPAGMTSETLRTCGSGNEGQLKRQWA